MLGLVGGAFKNAHNLHMRCINAPSAAATVTTTSGRWREQDRKFSVSFRQEPAAKTRGHRPESTHAEELKLRPARPDDRQVAGRLLREALTPQLADAVLGLGVDGGSTRYLDRLFQRPGTLWSYDLITLAEVDGVVAGLVSHAAWTELARRRRATLWAYLRVYGPARAFQLAPRLRALMRASPLVPPDHWFIPYLAVTPKHRGNGVAHALLDSVYRRARPFAPACSLYVLAENLTAHQFYRHAGFVERAYESSARLHEIAGIRGRMRLDRQLTGE